jgi:septum formation protein
MGLLWLGGRALVLASKSESRHAILHAAGIPHEVEPADIDERQIEQRAAAGTASQAAELLAREKALVVSAHRPCALVLGADQTLVVGGRRLSKPTDRAMAREQLVLLRHRTHDLHSAIAIARDNRVLFEHREVARLTMRQFSDAFLEAYLDVIGSAATASVGSYQLEKAGIQLFERIEGDHFVILGLPLLALLQFLRREGLLME